MPATRRKLLPILVQLEECLAPAAGAFDGTFGTAGKVWLRPGSATDSLYVWLKQDGF